MNGDLIKDITGSWSETFIWNSRHSETILEKTITMGSLERTSNLTFIGNFFSVKILPSYRVLKSINDSVFAAFLDDTLYTGKYQIMNNTLTFYLNSGKEPEVYNYTIQDDSLKIYAIAQTDTNGLTALPISSFLWANSLFKFSGHFIKAE